MKYIKKLIIFLRNYTNDSVYESTKIQKEYQAKVYPEKVILKNSIKLNFQLLLFGIGITFLLITNISEHSNKIYTILFCIILLVIPLYKIINQKPLLIISKEGLIISNRKKIKWTEIESTLIENQNFNDASSSFSLKIVLKNTKTIKISLSDLNYSEQEVSHIIELNKEKNRIAKTENT